MDVLRLRSLSLLLVLATLLGGGCSFVPTAELKVFRESVSTANAAATPLIDEYSAAERKLKRDTVVLQGGRPTFNYMDAAYFADIGDGPTATTFRRAHDTLDRLSSLLLSLATGADVEGDMKVLKGLITESAGLVSVIPPAASVEGQAQTIFTATSPVIAQLFRELNRREALRLIEEIQDKKLVDKLAASLVKATPAMFDILISEARLSRDPKIKDRIDKTRLVLSNYVVLLQRVTEAWNEAADAANSKASINTTAMTERIAELRAAALATRRAFVDLHNTK